MNVFALGIFLNSREGPFSLKIISDLSVFYALVASLCVGTVAALLLLSERLDTAVRRIDKSLPREQSERFGYNLHGCTNAASAWKLGPALRETVSSVEGNFSRVFLELNFELRSLTASILNTIGIIEKTRSKTNFMVINYPLLAAVQISFVDVNRGWWQCTLTAR